MVVDSLKALDPKRPIREAGIVFTSAAGLGSCPKIWSLPPKPRRRRPSSTRMMRSAIAAGLSVRGIKVDPVTGEYTVLTGESPPAKAADDTAIETADELRKLL